MNGARCTREAWHDVLHAHATEFAIRHLDDGLARNELAVLHQGFGVVDRGEGNTVRI